MPDTPPLATYFLSQITSIVEKNISNELFGVSEMADEMHMSRSNLLRKVMKLTNLSVSQFIRQVRLKHAMDLLRNSSSNVSEISHQVGFSSTSYFIKCFREYYGYPPGEAGKRNVDEPKPMSVEKEKSGSKRMTQFTWLASLIVVIALSVFLYYKRPFLKTSLLEKSIAVLPFKNESSDSTNLYLINGLMEATLNNLQKIKDLKVVSRTSTEKYRNISKSIPEMAKELNVSYFVEGSGQKIGNQILLNIQLIEASTDHHLWAQQYRRKTGDIFELQQDVAKNIAEEIQAIITPEEKARIDKIPTGDLVAYDLYLKGRDLFYKDNASSKDLEDAISYFKKAIARDKEFALAYADVVLVYYYLDFFQAEKKHASEISSYADKAMLFDAKLPESLVAKALYYMSIKENELAVPYFEKALEYNPNSGLAVHFLLDFYNIHASNTVKYLEYALLGLRLNVASHDSATTSFAYLQVSNAFIQAGFIDEAQKYIGLSMAFNPKNPYSRYLRHFIQFARNRNINQTRELLIKELEKDTNRFDILQEVGKMCYLMKDYENGYRYYKRFVDLKKAHQLDIYTTENLKIGIVFQHMGYKGEAETLIRNFKNYADADRSIYKHLNLAAYYAYRGENEKAIANVKLFTKQDNYPYWVLLFDHDPVVEPIKNNPQFRKAMREMETKFWNTHKKMKETLEEKGLI